MLSIDLLLEPKPTPHACLHMWTLGTSLTRPCRPIGSSELWLWLRQMHEDICLDKSGQQAASPILMQQVGTEAQDSWLG